MKNNFLPDRTHFMSGSLKYLLSDLILAVIITGIILLLLNPIIVHRGRPKISIRFNLSCDCKTDPVFVSYINRTEKINIPVLRNGNIFSSTVNIPELTQLQFDFSPAAGNIILSDFLCKGRKNLKLGNFTVAAADDLLNPRIDNDIFYGKVMKKNPSLRLRLQKPLSAKRRTVVRLWNFWIILICVFLISYAFIRWFNGMVIKFTLCKIADAGFVFLFILILILPASRVDDEKKSLSENRFFSVYKPLLDPDLNINFNFGKDFDKWFSDHFYGREFLLQINQYFSTYVFPTLQFDEVYQGRDGWSFYRGAGAMKSYHNLDSFNDKEIKQFADDLTILTEFCRSKNKKLYLFFPPDKHRAYGEFFLAAEKIRPDSQSRLLRLISYLNTHVKYQKAATPLFRLLDEKKNYPLYYKDDTHWNEMGAYYGYLELMQMIHQDVPAIPIWKAEKIEFKEKKDLGDLYLLSAKRTFFDPAIKYPYPVYKLDFQLSGVSYHTIGISRIYNPNGKLNLLMIRDSFASSMIPFLAQNFKNLNLIWSNTLEPSYVPLFNEADIVVIECVERNLNTLLTGMHTARKTIEGIR